MEWSQNYYEHLIQKVDQFTRKYYINQLIRGSLYFVGLVTLVFVTFNLLEDQFYFGKGIRKFMFFSFLASFMLGLWYWILRPMFSYFKLGQQISHQEAAKIIGTHFTDVKDKLLNVLQLKTQAIGFTDRSLIDASIQQKASELRPVPFVSAIDLSKNKKYLRYALLPLILLVALLVYAPDLIRNSTTRLVQTNKDFAKAAPFSFQLENNDLKVIQNGDFKLNVKIIGSALPSEVFIDVDHFQYRMRKEGPENYSYSFNNVQKDQDFTIFSGPIRSEGYKLEVLLKPIISKFQTQLNYPAYTGRKNELLENTGDLVVPVGTKITWRFATENTDELLAVFNAKDKNKIDQLGEDEFQMNLQAMQDGYYTLFFKNNHLSNYDSVNYQLSIIPDQYPQISVNPFNDSTDNKVIYFAGDASDDYGINQITFNYEIKHTDGTKENLKSDKVSSNAGKSTTFKHVMDLNSVNIKPGDHVSYYFEVWDNDGIHGSKSTKSSIMEYRLASMEELAQAENSNNEEIKKNLEKSVEEARKLQEKLKEYKDKMRQQKDVEWNDKKDLEKMLKEQEKIQQQFDEARKKFEENLKNQQQHSNPDENLLEKQEQLQKMMQENMSDEMKQLMKEIQNLMQQLNKEQAIQMSEKFENKNQEVEKEMDKLLELFKQLEVEKAVKDQVDQLRKLSEEQKQLADKVEKKEEKKDDLLKKQEDINKKFDELKKKQEELQKKNEELQRPNNLSDQKKNAEDAKKDLEKAKDKISKDDNKGGSDSGKQGAEKMDKMADAMENEMQSSEKEQQEEDIKVLRQLLENLVSLSFDQESLIKQFGENNPQTPKYVSLVQDEYRIKDNFRLIQDTLEELSKRQISIEKYVTEKVNEINDNFKQTMDNLEDRQLSKALNNEQRVMKNVNDLAVMLDESMNNLQKKKNAACNKPGSGACKKPGGKNPKGSNGKVPMDKISSGQEKMEKGLRDLQQKMKNGDSKLSQEFAQMAAKQAQLRKMLQDLEKEKREQGQGGNKEMEEIQKQMNQTEKELVNKQLTNETLKRQQEITTRLLEAERAEREREYKEERKSETGTNIDRKYPPSLEEYIKQRQAETEWFQHVSPDLRPFYKKLVEQYYQGLKKQG